MHDMGHQISNHINSRCTKNYHKLYKKINFYLRNNCTWQWVNLYLNLRKVNFFNGFIGMYGHDNFFLYSQSMKNYI